MKRIFDYLKEDREFSNNYKDLVKEIKVITDTPSDKVTEESLKGAINLLHKCEVSIERMDKLQVSMNGLGRLILKEKLGKLKLKKECFEIRKSTITIISSMMVKS